MIKTKAVIILVLLIIAMVVQKNAARGTDMGTCHFRNQSNKVLTVNDKAYKNEDSFRFVIEGQDVAEVEPIISNDQLVDLRRQLISADTLYQEVLGLTSPLDKPRYQKAGYIRVIMATIKGNGLAYDEVMADKALGSADCGINIKLSATLKASNSTPAHELFHLYQNSYFMFKNGWLTEGTARWSESLIDKGMGRKISSSLPQSRDELVETMDMSYAASAMWTRLFQLVDDRKVFDMPTTVRNAYYIDGDSVIDDNKAYGISFIKVLFEALEEQSKQAANDRGWDVYNWKESDQKSADNNVYVWRAVQHAVNKAVPKAQQSEELKRFVSISLSSS